MADRFLGVGCSLITSLIFALHMFIKYIQYKIIHSFLQSLRSTLNIFFYIAAAQFSPWVPAGPGFEPGGAAVQQPSALTTELHLSCVNENPTVLEQVTGEYVDNIVSSRVRPHFRFGSEILN